MKILITGAAGFIGFHLVKKLINTDLDVYGLDNLNNYYDVNLKFDRLNELGIKKSDAKKYNNIASHKNFKFINLDIEDNKKLDKLFFNYSFDVVCHLAAQAGVRYSLDNPDVYLSSNVLGFFNILNCCKKFKIKHLIYASSSSVYGANTNVPFSESDFVDNPISLYAATKKSNELLAHTYSHLYKIPTTGLRFFTVYGPWGRPDMAYYSFTRDIITEKEIDVYNYGKIRRDFTYIDDIISGISKIIFKNNNKGYKIYNIGNNKTVKLLDFINILQEKLHKKVKMNMLPIQDGDVLETWANIDKIKKDYGFSPKTDIKEGLNNFIDWYKNYHDVKK